MSDGFLRVPLDDVGKRIDTEELTVSAQTVQRERMQIAGALDVEIARILNTDPAAADHGLVVRKAALDSPLVVTASVATVSPGSTGDVDSAQITSSLTGKLLGFEASSSRPFKVELYTVLNAGTTLRSVHFGWHGRVEWTASDKDFIQQAQDVGAGFDGFRLTFTNLDTGAQAADMYGTFYYDEV